MRSWVGSSPTINCGARGWRSAPPSKRSTPGARPGTPGHVFVSRSGERWIRHEAEPVPYLVAVASQAPLPDVPMFSLLNDPKAAALTPPAPQGAGPSSEAARRALGAAGDRLFELWEPERLRRQVAIFEAALAAEMAANATHREDIADLQRRLEATSSALDDARDHITLLRQQGQDVSQATQQLEDENALLRDENAALLDQNVALRAELKEIVHSRAWRVLARYRAIRGSLPF